MCHKHFIFIFVGVGVKKTIVISLVTVCSNEDWLIKKFSAEIH